MEGIKFIAIYLPQFHPIKENNEWWGKGFTEWTNVTKAKPLFEGHYQPHLPADMGFYDLRLEEIRIVQAEMAKAFGIEGFSYYHYWFKGKRLLERPFNEVLESGKPDFPFCLFWANETWSRRWLGEERDILMKQEYDEADDLNHANYLVNAFKDPRYIKAGDRPLFTIYRPKDIPHIKKTTEIIRKVCLQELSVEPYLIASNSHGITLKEAENFGFDAILNFRPQLSLLSNAFEDGYTKERKRHNKKRYGISDGRLKIYEYSEALKNMQDAEPSDYNKVIPSVFIGWDNTARRGADGIIIVDNKPELLKKELSRIIQKLEASSDNPGFIFLNAWNEWAEGNHLEPDLQNGNSHLEVIKSFING